MKLLAFKCHLMCHSILLTRIKISFTVDCGGTFTLLSIDPYITLIHWLIVILEGCVVWMMKSGTLHAVTANREIINILYLEHSK